MLTPRQMIRAQRSEEDQQNLGPSTGPMVHPDFTKVRDWGLGFRGLGV